MGFSFQLPATELIFGERTHSMLGELAKGRGKHALLVTGKSSMEKSGFLARAIESLKAEGLFVTVFQGVEPNPTVETVNSGIERGIKDSCDIVIAIGGGSAIDAAKGMAVGIGHRDPDIWPYLRGRKETKAATLPIIAIPSTSGTGSHVTWYTVITNRETAEKGAYSSEHIYPKVSIVDTEILRGMPKKVTAETGFDALAHAMESYLSKGASPVTDALALQAIKLISRYLPRAYENGDDKDAREKMAVADSLAGICITSARTIMVHGIGNTVSGVYPNISHGEALAALTEEVMDFNIKKGSQDTITRYAEIARAFGKDGGDKKKLAMASMDAVRELRGRIGLEKSLSELGVSEDELGRLVDYSLKLGGGAIAANPVESGAQDIEEIYMKALKGHESL